MGFYSQIIFPRLLDWSLSDAVSTQYRQDLLSEISGDVLEIGFGTGLNLPHYPDRIEKITTIDVNPGMNPLAKKRIDNSSIRVEHHVLSGENLPMTSGSFDCVVSTWTLCSITDVDQAVREIHRVLKPGGKFYFIEHGLSNEPPVQVWQHRLTPIQKIIADGCHLDRNIQEIVEKQFSSTVEKFYTPDVPKVMGYMYKGVATKQ